MSVKLELTGEVNSLVLRCKNVQARYSYVQDRNPVLAICSEESKFIGTSFEPRSTELSRMKPYTFT